MQDEVFLIREIFKLQWEKTMNFVGRIALVTGSSKGIGKATAVALARLGATVVVTGRNVEAIEETYKEIRGLGGKCLRIVVDVAKEKEIEEMAREVFEKYGKIDVLVNNVGGSSPSVPLEELGNELWEQQLKSNLTSVFQTTRAVVKSMKERKYGRVVNVASVAGRSYSHLGGVPYASAKHGVIGFTRQLAKELAPYSITVNAVAPGLIATERVLKKLEARGGEERNEILSKILLRRPGRPEEVAGAIVFLSSDRIPRRITPSLPLK